MPEFQGFDAGQLLRRGAEGRHPAARLHRPENPDGKMPSLRLLRENFVYSPLVTLLWLELLLGSDGRDHGVVDIDTLGVHVEDLAGLEATAGIGDRMKDAGERTWSTPRMMSNLSAIGFSGSITPSNPSLCRGARMPRPEKDVEGACRDLAACGGGGARR